MTDRRQFSRPLGSHAPSLLEQSFDYKTKTIFDFTTSIAVRSCSVLVGSVPRWSRRTLIARRLRYRDVSGSWVAEWSNLRGPRGCTAKVTLVTALLAGSWSRHQGSHPQL